MKTFPRIHSLSALKLRHHQAFDYAFHPLRTDFTGESGCGKSIIADLLQLIFIGPKEFQSATQGLEGERLPDGQNGLLMPGEPLGYAFLNIQLADGEFIVIGVQIENVRPGVRLFVIQASFDFDDRLVPFTEPFTYKNFQDDERVLRLDELADIVEKQGFGLKSYPSVRAYHALLYRNEILPIDLTLSDQTLKTYASIIQAFSRRKSLDPKKPKELQEFLFGNEKAQAFWRQYQNLIKSLQRDEDDYKFDRGKVEQIQEKDAALISLRQRQETYHRAKFDFFKARLNDSFRNRLQAKSILKTAFEHCSDAYSTLLFWRRYCQQQGEKLRNRREPLQQAEQDALAALENSRGPFQRFKTVQGWLLDLRCEALDLPDQFKNQNELNKAKRYYHSLQNLLNGKNLWTSFVDSGWTHGWDAGSEWATQKLLEIQTDFDHRESLLDFSDIHNPDSLGHWAYHYPHSLDRESVSTLMGMVNLSTSKPVLAKIRDQFLPNPDKFFQSLPVTLREIGGFWLDLGGIYEYFPYRDDCFNDLHQPEERKIFLKKWNIDLSGEIKELKKRHSSLEVLRLLLINLENRNDVLAAYTKRDLLNGFSFYGGFGISPEEFNRHFECHANADAIVKTHKEAELKYREARSQVETTETDLGRLTDLFNDFDHAFNSYDKTVEHIEEYLANYIDDFPKPAWKAPKVHLDFKENFQASRTALRERQGALVSLSEWQRLQNAWTQAEQDFSDAEQGYQSAYGTPPELPLPEYSGDLSAWQSNYSVAKVGYETEYKHVVQRFLPDNAHELEGSFDFIDLVRHLFPGLLGQNVTEAGALTRITEQLKEILQRIRELNKRRLNALSELLREVDDARQEIGRSVRHIERFFENEAHIITGGNRVKLSLDPSLSYPIDWIYQFRRELSESEEFAKRFVDQITLEEKLIAAYQACGGILREVKVQDLLNPNSYQQLDFSMVSAHDSDQKNVGSTGQTYAAIALLCIARLSLIGQKKRKGVRFMPIDEAEGLGSNYDMLYQIARTSDYQLVSLSIGLIGAFSEGNQYVYMLQRDFESSEPINYTPFAILSRADLNDLDRLDDTENDEDEFGSGINSTEDHSNEDSREENKNEIQEDNEPTT